jgi:pyruvate dehydrogenase E1 component alpha subunit
MGGSMHIAEIETGNLGANGIVGGGFPIAVGAALTSKMKKDNKVTLCYAGDGATNEGSFHESLNMASIWDLPVIFFIENNQYGMSGSIKEMTNIENLSQRSEAYGIVGVTINGNDLIEVIDTTYEAVQRARRGEGPTLIEAKTYRWKGHSKSDARKYRTRDEEDYFRNELDPILLAQERFIEAGVFTEEEALQIKEKAREIIEESVVYATESEPVSMDDLLTDVYAE